MKGWKYAAIGCAAGIALSVGVGFIALHGSGTKLDAAIDGYRASVISDYASRKSYIAQLEAATRPGIEQVALLRSELADATANAERARQAESDRQRGEDERAAAIRAGLGQGLSDSAGCTDVLAQALALVDRLLGQ